MIGGDLEVLGAFLEEWISMGTLEECFHIVDPILYKSISFQMHLHTSYSF